MQVHDLPDRLYVCHCTECRRQSASAFGISARVPARSLEVTQGATRVWSRRTDRGHRLDCHFCADCGTRLWHAAAGSDTITVKGGTFDAPPDISTAIHIWTDSRLPGVEIPAGAISYSGEPPD